MQVTTLRLLKHYDSKSKEKPTPLWSVGFVGGSGWVGLRHCRVLQLLVDHGLQVGVGGKVEGLAFDLRHAGQVGWRAGWASWSALRANGLFLEAGFSCTTATPLRIRQGCLTTPKAPMADAK